MKIKISLLTSVIGAVITICAFFTDSLKAQALSKYEGGCVSNTTEYAEKLWIGPDAVITVDGDWTIFSREVFIHSRAIIRGNGRIIIENPKKAGFAPVATIIDGGSAAIDVPLVLSNPRGIILKSLSVSDKMWENAAQAEIKGTDDLVVGKGLTFLNQDDDDDNTICSNHIYLGNHNLIFSAGASSATGFGANSHIIINGRGRVVKKDLAAASTFSFPVGISASDFSPAVVTQGQTTQDVRLGVSDYATSLPLENMGQGMDRTWEISTGAQKNLENLVLYHNPKYNGETFSRITPIYGTRIIAYKNNIWSDATPSVAENFVAETPYNGLWAQRQRPKVDALLASTGTIDAPFYYTKITQDDLPIADTNSPNGTTTGVKIAIKVFLQGAYDLSSGLMKDDLRRKNRIPTKQPYGGVVYEDFAYTGAETTFPEVLSVTENNAIVDWVLVELREANNPTKTVARRAALLQRDGDVVDVDGVSSLAFANVLAGKYFVAIRHRNHLGAMAGLPVSLSTTTTTILDFTNPSTALYQRSDALKSDSAMRTIINGTTPVRVLWQGNAAYNHKILSQDINNNQTAIQMAVMSAANNVGAVYNFVLGGYYREDTNMSGEVVFQGNDNDIDATAFSVLTYSLNDKKLSNFMIYQQLP